MNRLSIPLLLALLLAAASARAQDATPAAPDMPAPAAATVPPAPGTWAGFQVVSCLA